MRNRLNRFCISRWSLGALGVLVLGLILRLWGINFGLPYVYHPDEPYLVMPALSMIRTGELRPTRLDYGSAYIYSLSALYLSFYLFDYWRGYLKSPLDLPVYSDFHRISAYPFPGIFLMGRVSTVLFGTLTVLVVYQIGKQLAGQRAGLVGAALFAVEPLHVSNSHFVTTDVPMTMFVTLALLKSIAVFDTGRRSDYFWAGIFVGLAASTKYLAGVAFAVLLTAHVLREKSRTNLLNMSIGIGLAAVIGGFLIGTPFALDIDYFRQWLAVGVDRYSGSPGTEAVSLSGPSWFFYLKELILGPSGLIGILGIGGLVLAMKKNSRRGSVLLAFPVLYGVLIGLRILHLPRYLVPIIPFLAIGSGIAIDLIIHGLLKRFRTLQLHETLVAVGLAALIFGAPFVATIQSDLLLAGPDIRTQALEWFQANVPREAKIALDPMGPPVFDWSRDIYVTWNVAEHEPNWYREHKFDYIVVNEALLLDPNINSRQQSSYVQLMSSLTPLRTFEGSMLGNGGLHLWVYRVSQ